MKIVLMAAISPNRVIGRDGAIPWHYPADMRYVRKTTTGHPCVMGRKTWESLPRRPLPGRPNLVLTRRGDYEVAAGVIVCASFEEARRHCEAMAAERMFVLGGEEVFREALVVADEMLITHVPDRVEGDVHFPEWDEREWDEREWDEREWPLRKERRDPSMVSPPHSENMVMLQVPQQEGLRFASYVRRRGSNRHPAERETESDV